MSDQNDNEPGRGLSRGQKRILLWMPLTGLWLVLFLVSRGPEGGRDWPSLIMMLVVCGAVYVGIWIALTKITSPTKTKRLPTEQRAAQKGSRAALIYDREEEEECDEES